MANPVQIRHARPEDEHQVLQLLDAANLEAEFYAQQYHVAETDRRIVACGRLKPLPDGTHELASVAVHPDHRRTGIGKRLVTTLLAESPGPIHALALAPGFFEKLAFQRIDEPPDVLREKADTVCASTQYVPMTRPAR